MSLNPFQKQREINIDSVRRLIAKTMPNGADDKKLRGLLSKKFSKPKVSEYLEVLSDCGEVELIDGKWRIVDE